MAYGNTDHVSTRLLRPAQDHVETALASMLLDDVERLIKRQITDLDAQVTAGTILIEDIQMVESRVVARVLRNPDNFIEETDGNYSYRRESVEEDLRLTEEDWLALGVTNSRSFFLIAPKMDVPWLNGNTDELWWQRYGEWY